METIVKDKENSSEKTKAAQSKAIKYITMLSDEGLTSALDYLRYLYERDYPLDEFDYELARRADEDKSTETFTFDEILKKFIMTPAQT